MSKRKNHKKRKDRGIGVISPSKILSTLHCFSSPLSGDKGQRYSYNPYIDALILGDEESYKVQFYWEYPHRALTATRAKCFMRILVDFIHASLARLPFIADSFLAVPLDRRSWKEYPQCVGDIVSLHALLNDIYESLVFCEEVYATQYAISAMREKQLELTNGIDVDQTEDTALLLLADRFGDNVIALYNRLKNIHDIRIGRNYTFWIPAYALNTNIPEVLPTDFSSVEQYRQHVLSRIEPPQKRFYDILTAFENLPYIGIRNIPQNEFVVLLTRHFSGISPDDHFMCCVNPRNCPVMYTWIVNDKNQVLIQRRHRTLIEKYDSLGNPSNSFMGRLCLSLCDTSYKSYGARYQAMINSQSQTEADNLQSQANIYIHDFDIHIYFADKDAALRAIFYESVRQQIFSGRGLSCPFLGTDTCLRGPCHYSDYLNKLWELTRTSSKSSSWQEPCCPFSQ